MTTSAICAVRDSASGLFGRPVQAVTLAVAIRAFQQEISNPDVNNAMNSHPEDFELHHIADYDDSTGQLRPLDTPVLIARGKDAAAHRDFLQSGHALS